jgi:hypothetical protein
MDKEILIFSHNQWNQLASPTDAEYFRNKVIQQAIFADNLSPSFRPSEIIIDPKGDKTSYFFIERMNYEHCCVYLVLQFHYNTGTLRLMAYGYNRYKRTKFNATNIPTEEQVSIPIGQDLGMITAEKIINQFNNCQLEITEPIIVTKLNNKDILYFI